MEPPDGGRALTDHAQRYLDRLRTSHRYRSRRIVRPIDATHIEIDGQRFVNFASNDYLGLAHHPALRDAAQQAIARDGIGSGASPLVTGYSGAHASAEAAIAQWKGTEACVLLNSGFAANSAAVQALAAIGAGAGGAAPNDANPASGDPQRSAPAVAAPVRFLLDKLCHASLLDAVRGVGAAYRIFPHNNLDKLARLLRTADPGQMQVVVTESIFSMDGDAADLPGLVALKPKHPFVLLLDEAHATGVYGPNGKGLASELDHLSSGDGSRGASASTAPVAREQPHPDRKDTARLSSSVDITIVTLSKALGCLGGAICASAAFCQTVVNAARPYIYSTHLPPSLAAAAEAGIDVLRMEPWRQSRVRDLARRVRAELHADSIDLPPGDSPIIPVILGSEQAALEAADRLRTAGLWTVAIRPPTVAPNASRLRLTLSCGHTDDEIAQLVRHVRLLHAPK